MKLDPCPACGETNLLPIVFGLPGDELREQASRGEVVLGGCMPLQGVRGACAGCGAWRRANGEIVDPG